MNTEENILKLKKQKIKIHPAWILFAIYIIVLVYFLFFAEVAGRTYKNRGYDYNIIPFREITRFIEYRKKLGWFAVIVNLGGNIAAFVPFGCMLPALVKRLRYFHKIFLLSFFFSFCIETTQLITKVGCFDVDDMILNTLGGILGFTCFFIIYAIRRKKNGKTL